jgi:hypothetical protein
MSGDARRGPSGAAVRNPAGAPGPGSGAGAGDEHGDAQGESDAESHGWSSVLRGGRGVHALHRPAPGSTRLVNPTGGAGAPGAGR